MPLPFILGATALLGVRGMVKVKDAKDTMNAAQSKHEESVARFKENENSAGQTIERLNKLELKILHSFQFFSDTFEKIKNRPVFKPYSRKNLRLPQYNPIEIKEVSVNAGILLSGMSAGIASSVLTTLGGPALTNAALGAGALGVGALGVSALTMGLGPLLGGVALNFSGRKLSQQADEAYSQAMKEEAEVDRICGFLTELSQAAAGYHETLRKVKRIYQEHLNCLDEIVNTQGRTDWDEYSPAEKLLTENTVLLVNLLYQMCKVELVKKSESENDMNTVNQDAISKSARDAEQFLADRNLAA